MRHIIRKLFLDYEKEELWINEMASKGMLLVDYKPFCKYVFIESPCKHEYIYRVELCKHSHKHSETQDYISFLESVGVECIASSMKWLYLRKKKADGPFDLYTDIESKIKHYNRVNLLWKLGTIFAFICALVNLIIGVFNIVKGYSLQIGILDISISIFILLMGGYFYYLSVPIKQKVKKLKQEQIIRE